MKHAHFQNKRNGQITLVLKASWYDFHNLLKELHTTQADLPISKELLAVLEDCLENSREPS